MNKKQEEEFDETWTAIKGTKMAEDIKTFINKLLKEKEKNIKEKLKEDEKFNIYVGN